MAWNMHIVHVDEQLLCGSDGVLVYKMHGQSNIEALIVTICCICIQRHRNCFGTKKMLVTIMTCLVHMYSMNILNILATDVVCLC